MHIIPIHIFIDRHACLSRTMSIASHMANHTRVGYAECHHNSVHPFDVMRWWYAVYLCILLFLPPRAIALFISSKDCSVTWQEHPLDILLYRRVCALGGLFDFCPPDHSSPLYDL